MGGGGRRIKLNFAGPEVHTGKVGLRKTASKIAGLAAGDNQIKPDVREKKSWGCRARERFERPRKKN